MLDHLQSVGSDKFEDLLASVWKGPDGAEMMDAAVALERGQGQGTMGAGRSDGIARQHGIDTKPMGPSTPYKEASPRAVHGGRMVGGPAGAAQGRPVISLPSNEEDGGLCWSPTAAGHGGPRSPSMTVSPVPQRVQSPFANGPGGLLMGSHHPAGHLPTAPEAGPSAARMKAPAGSNGLSNVLNRAWQAGPSGSGDASRRSSTSSYQNLSSAAAAGVREYPSSARQMSCLGTGRYGSALRGDGSGDLLGDTDVAGGNRPRRTTRRTVESRHKDSAIWSDAVDDKLAKQEKRMLKNRESAARSRLRRQQFTEGLERENANLKAEVFDLRDQVAAMADQLDHVQQLLAAAKATGGMSGSTASAALAYFQSRCVLRETHYGDEDAAAEDAEAEAEEEAEAMAAAAGGDARGHIKEEVDVPQQERLMLQQKQCPMHTGGAHDTLAAADRGSCHAAGPSTATAAPMPGTAAAAAAAAAVRAYSAMSAPQQQLKRPRDVPPEAAAAAAAAAMESSGSLLHFGGVASKGGSLPTSARSLDNLLVESDALGLWGPGGRGPSLDLVQGLDMLPGSCDMDGMVDGTHGPLMGANSTGLMSAWAAAGGRPYKRSRQSSC